MSTGYWQRTITNDAGDIIANAQIEVREPSADFTGALVSLVDIDGAGLSNPFNADSEGFARFGTSPQLVDIRATGSGSQRTWRRVEVLGTAATQSDDRYAHRANNLSDLANAGTSRDNLGLGTAAVADLTTGPTDETGALRAEDAYAAGSRNWHDGNLVKTTSPTDTTVGRLLQVGDGGVLAGLTFDDSDIDALPGRSTSFSYRNDGSTNKPTGLGGFLSIIGADSDSTLRSYNWIERNGSRDLFRVLDSSGDFTPWRERYHTGNTIVDGNGFIKEA